MPARDAAQPAAGLNFFDTANVYGRRRGHVDCSTPWEEIWQAMELLVQQGKVLYIGSSNNEPAPEAFAW